MKRIAIIGCGGAGKSTLARQLGEALGLPVFHLDAEIWKPGWIMSSDEEEQAIITGLLERPKWIIDGNYGSTMPQRFDVADTLIFLDFPRRVCLYRILKRRWQYRGKTRPDMAQGCPERLDGFFLKWVWNYQRTHRPKVLQMLEGSEARRQVIILRCPKDVRRFFHGQTWRKRTTGI